MPYRDIEALIDKDKKNIEDTARIQKKGYYWLPPVFYLARTLNDNAFFTMGYLNDAMGKKLNSNEEIIARIEIE